MATGITKGIGTLKHHYQTSLLLRSAWLGKVYYGGSTTRELFEQVVNNLGISEKVVDQRCDLAQGFGCYDCARGFHSSHYNSTLLPTLQTFFLPDVHDVCSYELVRRVDARQFLTQMLTC